MQILKAGVLYFALVFGAGFVLGTIRILWVVPSFGTRMAELTRQTFEAISQTEQAIQSKARENPLRKVEVIKAWPTASGLSCML